MELYFNRKSLSHYKVYDDSITVYLVGGDSFTVNFNFSSDKMSCEKMLRSMLNLSCGYSGIAWYDSAAGKIYFGR